LYGSDRSFAQAVAAIIRSWPTSRIEVMLPRRGPIMTLAPFDEIGATIRDMWILRRRNLVSGFTLGLPRNLVYLYRAWRDMRRADLVYINTIIGFDFIAMARLSRTPVIIHVREIPNGLEMRLFRRLLLWSRAKLIFNSQATLAAFRLPETVPASVVYNGFQGVEQARPPRWEEGRPLQLVVLGRFNHWKGQEVVIKAIGALGAEEKQKVHLRLVGDSFNGQDEFKRRLEKLIAELGLETQVELCPFENDPFNSYEAADVVIVPSQLPEPFGRVAIEAMGHARAVICSAHGGLVEIVEHGRTGYHVPPSDERELAQAIRQYLTDATLITRHGEAGLARFLEKFTADASDRSLIAEIKKVLG
jgi:glycosyltransferase involved in cell wall biosynthesis